jgi:NAD(P)-dependent dehydrogenase (short-subunit alcohol dehydrogenase family)
MPSYLVTGSSRGLGLHFVEELVRPHQERFPDYKTKKL